MIVGGCFEWPQIPEDKLIGKRKLETGLSGKKIVEQANINPRLIKLKLLKNLMLSFNGIKTNYLIHKLKLLLFIQNYVEVISINGKN